MNEAGSPDEGVEFLNYVGNRGLGGGVDHY